METLTIKSIKARPLLLKLERPIVARIATLSEWPVILVDLFTNQGIAGRSYIEPYAPKAMKYIIAALEDFGELLQGRQVAPAEIFEIARKSLHFVGYQGLSLIAVSGLDMAAWDALARAADLPLCVLLGGTVGPVKVYNSNGLWLREPEAVAAEAIELRDEGGFTGLKLRLGRERAPDDLATIDAVRKAVGDEMQLMVDFNQGLNLAEALHRCHMIDEYDLAWIEEPVIYDNLDGCAQLARELETPIQIGENFYGPREMHKALQRQACVQARLRNHLSSFQRGVPELFAPAPGGAASIPPRSSEGRRRVWPTPDRLPLRARRADGRSDAAAGGCSSRHCGDFTSPPRRGRSRTRTRSAECRGEQHRNPHSS